MCVCVFITYFFDFQQLFFELKYKICVIVYCDVVNVQPRFNFSDEIIILNSATLNTVIGTWNIEAPLLFWDFYFE